MGLPARTPKGTKFRKFGDPRKPEPAAAVAAAVIRCEQLLQLTASHGGRCDLLDGHQGAHLKEGQAYPLFGADVSAPAGEFDGDPDPPGIITDDFVAADAAEAPLHRMTPLQEVTAARLWYAVMVERRQGFASRWAVLSEDAQGVLVGQLRLIIAYGRAPEVERRDGALALAIARVVSGWRA